MYSTFISKFIQFYRLFNERMTKHQSSSTPQCSSNNDFYGSIQMSIIHPFYQNTKQDIECVQSRSTTFVIKKSLTSFIEQGTFKIQYLVLDDSQCEQDHFWFCINAIRCKNLFIHIYKDQIVQFYTTSTLSSTDIFLINEANWTIGFDIRTIQRRAVVMVKFIPCQELNDLVDQYMSNLFKTWFAKPLFLIKYTSNVGDSYNTNCNKGCCSSIYEQWKNKTKSIHHSSNLILKLTRPIFCSKTIQKTKRILWNYPQKSIRKPIDISDL